MSELFSWLKQTEQQKRKGLSEVGSRPASVQVPDLRATAPELGPRAPEVPETPSARLEIVDSARFNLEMADWRVRTVLDHRTLVGERYRFLRAKLALLQRQRGIKTVVVTSSVPGEGKTFTACCLAGILAQEPGKRILLVDADMRKPRAAFSLGMDSEISPGGLSQLLQGEARLEESLLRCSNLDFFFLPSGPVPVNPSELLSSPNLEKVVRKIATVFDWVVIDCPPVLALADATRLAPLCDTVLMVVLANKTPSKLIQQAIQMIGRDLICGVVLNRVANIKSSHYQYYQYYNDKPKVKK